MKVTCEGYVITGVHRLHSISIDDTGVLVTFEDGQHYVFGVDELDQLIKALDEARRLRESMLS